MTVVKPDHLQTVVKAIRDISFGFVVLIVQDAHLIQMEKTEKVRFAGNAKNAAGKNALPVLTAETAISNKVLAALKDMEYGQVLFSIKEGEIIQIERTEKQRIKKYQGLDGEGI